MYCVFGNVASPINDLPMIRTTCSMLNINININMKYLLPVSACMQWLFGVFCLKEQNNVVLHLVHEIETCYCCAMHVSYYNHVLEWHFLRECPLWMLWFLRGTLLWLVLMQSQHLKLRLWQMLLRYVVLSVNVCDCI